MILKAQKTSQNLKPLSCSQVALFLNQQVKANLEMTLVSALSVSNLKVNSSPLNSEMLTSLIAISSNLLAQRGVKEQAESPLLPALLQFQRNHPLQSIEPLCFANFINLQNQINRQYALSHNQQVCYAQMHQSFFIEQNRKVLKEMVEDSLYNGSSSAEKNQQEERAMQEQQQSKGKEEVLKVKAIDEKKPSKHSEQQQARVAGQKKVVQETVHQVQMVKKLHTQVEDNIENKAQGVKQHAQKFPQVNESLAVDQAQSKEDKAALSDESSGNEGEKMDLPDLDEESE